MTFVSEPLDSCVLVVKYGNVIVLLSCVCSVEELPSENVDTSWLVLHGLKIYKW